MSAAKFTQGPWVAKFGGLIEIEASTVPRGPHGDPAIVAEVCDDGVDTAAARADAFLIAAAPDLFEALSRAMEWAGTIVADEGFVPDGLLTAMHDALLKAGAP